MTEEKKMKILTLGDSPLLCSGVGTQTKYLIEGLLGTGKYEVVSLGGAIKHDSYQPQKFQQWGDAWTIYPIDGYGTPELVRQFLDHEKPDAVFFISDPRFYHWLLNLSDEINDRNIPLMWWTIWDALPVPAFNKGFYDSCTFLGCISKVTHKIVCELGSSENSEYIPHAVDSDVFKQHSEEDILKRRASALGVNKDRFVIFYNSRNARRKMTGDVLAATKKLIDEVGSEKVFLLMHTNPKDSEGGDLEQVGRMLGLTNQQLAFSTGRLPMEALADLYNLADVTINISSQEGFGLSCLESMSCGTPVVVNKTGGLQDQPVADDGSVFGVLIEPAARNLVGSQQIPFILDERCNVDDVAKALKTVYDMSREERREMGTKAREHTLEKFSMKSMISKWDDAFTKYIGEFREHGNKNRIRIGKI